MNRNRPLSFLIITFFLFMPLGAWANKLHGLDNYVNNLMAISHVPGVAISVVKSDEVVFAQGFGVREAGKRDPVDKDTVFAIGSNTKFFTATALGILVNESKISWDKPLSHYLPGLRFSDPYLTASVNLRDALSHRTGLAASDLVWFANPGTSVVQDNQGGAESILLELPAEPVFRIRFERRKEERE